MRDYNGYLLYFELPVSFEEISKTKIRNKKYVLEKNSSSSYIDEALKVWNKLSAKKNDLEQLLINFRLRNFLRM